MIVVEVLYKCIGVHWPILFVGTGVRRATGGGWAGRAECCKWKRVFGTPLQSLKVRFGFQEGGRFQELNILVSPHFRAFRTLECFFLRNVLLTATR